MAKGDRLPDRDGVYDAVADVSDEWVRVDWPEVDPTHRNLDALAWGVYGEGPPELWDQFVEMLNDGRLGDQPAELRPDAPRGWGEPRLPMIRSNQKRRGKHLFAHVGATPETMLRVEGVVGERHSGVDREEFATRLEPKVLEYADRFEDGDRPGEFFAVVDPDDGLAGPQEGRHRAAAAMLAGLQWVPLVVLYDTGGTFGRRRGDNYRARYPDDRDHYGPIQ